MGLGLTIKNFLSHIATEPAAAFGSLGYSGKDIIEILFFYFTELSLTASYVILIALVLRFVMHKATKYNFYGLWIFVYIKLIVPFAYISSDINLVPHQQIDAVYNNITPSHHYFYDTEAGFVSLVESEFTEPVPVVTPIYLPALIWFIVLTVLLCLAASAVINIVFRNINCKENLKENIYICQDISSPFVFGIFRPKIYLPEGLTEQEQFYVITHEKMHIRQWDHIIKLLAFVITCIHWFNPLAWLSFFMLEKDMEMFCDENVLDKIGYEHKKDYSRCILSLATDKRFVPRAYLSFGDSDIKQRVKNVLNYKKPSFWIKLFTAVVLAVFLIGISAEKEPVPYPFDRYSSHTVAFEAKGADISFDLPEGWYAQTRTERGNYPDYLSLDENLSCVADIYDSTGKNVGAFACDTYNLNEYTYSNPAALYGAVALPNMYRFNTLDADTGDGFTPYTVVAQSDKGETAVTGVYHSPSLVHNDGGRGDAIYNKGILSYNKDFTVFAAIEFDDDALTDADLNYIAKSVTFSKHYAMPVSQINFPVYDQRTEHNGEIFDKSFALLMNLPKGWGVKIPDSDDLAYPLVGVWNRMTICNENDEPVGAMGYNIFDTAEAEPMAIYNQIALGNHYQFDVRSEKYIDVVTSDIHIVSTTNVYTSANMAQQFGMGNEETVNHGILCRNSKLGVYVAMEIDKNAIDDAGLNNFAHSIFIAEPVVDNPFASDKNHASRAEIAELGLTERKIETLYAVGQKFGLSLEELKSLYNNKASTYFLSYELYAAGNDAHIENVLKMFIEGKTEIEVRDFAKDYLLNNGLTEDNLKTFGNTGHTMYEVYCMTEETINGYITSWSIPQPRLLTYEHLAGEMVEKYKNNDIVYNSDFHPLPADFIFPEVIMWDSRTIYLNDMGYYVVPIASAQGSNVMYVSINDSEYLSAAEKNFDIQPVVHSVSFQNPLVSQWNLSVKCAKKSSPNEYIITYCDDKIISETGTLYLTNTNDFDITVHLQGKGNEITVDLPSGTSTDISTPPLEKDVYYTVGLHADVEEDTEINLTVFELY